MLRGILFIAVCLLSVSKIRMMQCFGIFAFKNKSAGCKSKKKNEFIKCKNENIQSLVNVFNRGTVYLPQKFGYSGA